MEILWQRTKGRHFCINETETNISSIYFLSAISVFSPKQMPVKLAYNVVVCLMQPELLIFKCAK